MQSPTSTFGLIERFKNGEEEAFSLLFEKYRRRLGVLIHYKLSPELRARMEVDDVLQETFLAASRNIAQFTYRSPGSFMAWLSRIAENVILGAARFYGRQKRQADVELRFRSVSNPEGPEPVDPTTPSRVFAQEEQVRALLGKLNALPDDYRQIILLAKVEGLSTQEMAERLGKSREAVSLLLHRAVQRFRKLENSTE